MLSLRFVNFATTPRGYFMPSNRYTRNVSVLATALLPITNLALDAQKGQTSRDEILLGLHYGDISNHKGRREVDYPRNIWPFFQDYIKHMEDDMLATSYADFWRWWYILDRYKGDEKGLEEFDQIVDACLERGLKVITK